MWLGNNNVVYLSGSNSTGLRGVVQSFVGGNQNIISSSYVGGTSTLLTNTMIYGNNLMVSASNASATVGGSTFIGRYNATGSLQESSQDTVFVVGTGTADNNRRNALRIDSNNNSNFTGSVNISGSLSVNGATITSSDRNGLITTGSAFSDQTIEGTLRVSGSANQPFQILSGPNTAQINILNSGPAFYRNSNTYNTVIGNAKGLEVGFTGSNNMLFTGFFLGALSATNFKAVAIKFFFCGSVISDTVILPPSTVVFSAKSFGINFLNLAANSGVSKVLIKLIFSTLPCVFEVVAG
jgi:hypothetical protein